MAMMLTHEGRVVLYPAPQCRAHLFTSSTANAPVSTSELEKCPQVRYSRGVSFERRLHARVAVPIDARLVLGDQEVAFTVREVSRSGIFLYTQRPPAEVGSEITLKLAITAGIKPLTLRVEVVRISYDEGGTILGMGLKFLQVSDALTQELVSLIDRALVGRGTQMRAYPRVSYLLSVRCVSKVELNAMLRDIGEGGVGLETSYPFKKDDEVTVEVTRPGKTVLRLRGWVVSCAPAQPQRERYRVGICFTALAPALRTELVEFIRGLYRR